MKGVILKERYKYIARCKKYDEVSCCKGMIDDLFDEVCEFDITYRRFYIHLISKYEDYWQTLTYCPYCGAKLPNLSDEYEYALEEALGKDYCDIKSDEIPNEFKTDEWWKKRHLDDPKVLEEWRKKFS